MKAVIYHLTEDTMRATGCVQKGCAQGMQKQLLFQDKLGIDHKGKRKHRNAVTDRPV